MSHVAFNWVMSRMHIHWQTNQSFYPLTNEPIFLFTRTQATQNSIYVYPLICMCTDMYVHWHVCALTYVHWHVYALTCICTAMYMHCHVFPLDIHVSACTCICSDHTYIYIHWLTKQSLLVTYAVTHTYPPMSHVAFNWVMSCMYIHWRTNQSLLSPDLQPHRPEHIYMRSHLYSLDIHVYAVDIHVYAVTCICTDMYVQWTYMYIHRLTNQPISPCHIWCHAHIPINESCHF